MLENSSADGSGRTVGVSYLLDNEISQEFTSFIQGGTLCTSTDTRVHTKNTCSLDGLLHQQVFQVFAENADSVVVGLVGLVATDFTQNGGRKETNKAVFNGFSVIAIVNNVLVLQYIDGAVHIYVQGNFQLAFSLTTVNGQNTVRLYLVQGFFIIPVHLVYGNLGFFLTTDSLYHDFSGTNVEATNIGTIFAVLSCAFCQDVLGSRQGVGNRGHGKLWIFSVFHHEFCGLCFDSSFIQLKHGVCQGIQALFNGHHSSGLLLFLEGCPQIFQLCESFCGHGGFVEGIRQFILGKNTLYNLKTAGLKV